MTRPTCEDRLFTCGSYDFVTDTGIMFHDCVLKEQIGESPAGTQVGGIFVDPESSTITLQNFNEDGSLKDEYSFELEYKVGDKIVA